jgi:hypothetical protein
VVVGKQDVLERCLWKVGPRHFWDKAELGIGEGLPRVWWRLICVAVAESLKQDGVACRVSRLHYRFPIPFQTAPSSKALKPPLFTNFTSILFFFRSPGLTPNTFSTIGAMSCAAHTL